MYAILFTIGFSLILLMIYAEVKLSPPKKIQKQMDEAKEKRIIDGQNIIAKIPEHENII